MPEPSDRKRIATWRRRARWLRRNWLAALTLLTTLLIGTGQLIIIGNQLHLDWLDKRPWLTVALSDFPPGVPSLRVDSDSNGIRITTGLALSNVGHLPAESVTILPTAWPTIPHLPAESAAMRAATCHDPNVFGSTIFPASEHAADAKFTYSFYLTLHQLRQYWLANPYNDNDVHPFAVICVAYRDPSGTPHHSLISFSIMPYNEDGTPAVMTLDEKQLSKLRYYAQLDGYAMDPD